MTFFIKEEDLKLKSIMWCTSFSVSAIQGEDGPGSILIQTFKSVFLGVFWLLNIQDWKCPCKNEDILGKQLNCLLGYHTTNTRRLRKFSSYLMLDKSNDWILVSLRGELVSWVRFHPVLVICQGTLKWDKLRRRQCALVGPPPWSELLAMSSFPCKPISQESTLMLSMEVGLHWTYFLSPNVSTLNKSPFSAFQYDFVSSFLFSSSDLALCCQDSFSDPNSSSYRNKESKPEFSWCQYSE